MKPQEFMDEILRRTFPAAQLDARTLAAQTCDEREALQLVALLSALEARKNWLETPHDAARWRRDAARIRRRAAAFLTGVQLSEL